MTMATDTFRTTESDAAALACTGEGEGEVRRLAGERDAAEAHAIAQTRALHRMEERLGITAHELKSPLTSSKLAVQLAINRLSHLRAQCSEADERLSGQFDAVPTLLAQALTSMDQLARLVDDLADVSRLRTGAVDLRLGHCDVTSVVREVVEEQRRLAPGRSLRLLPPAEPAAPVLADGDRIRQVVTNYVTNALRYAPADRPIEIEVRRRARWIWVLVRDEGPGVPREERGRIWERFHRAAIPPVLRETGSGSAETRSERGPGLGLGLHICKTLVEQHQGRVGRWDARSGGSVFWFALPIAQPGTGAA